MIVIALISVHPTTYGPPNHIETDILDCVEPRGSPLWEIGAGQLVRVVCVQGVHLSKEVVVFSCPLMLVMPVLGLHIDLDQLEDEATIIRVSGNTEVIFLSFFLFISYWILIFPSALE